ncbi:hypothetical protein T492DRAFT_1145744, partial [Pavlovales sp. CCMP2436]
MTSIFQIPPSPLPPPSPPPVAVINGCFAAGGNAARGRELLLVAEDMAAEGNVQAGNAGNGKTENGKAGNGFRGLDLTRTLPVEVSSQWVLQPGSVMAGMCIDVAHSHPLMRGGAAAAASVRGVRAYGAVGFEVGEALPKISFSFAVGEVTVAAGRRGTEGASLRGSRLRVWPHLAGGRARG